MEFERGVSEIGEEKLIKNFYNSKRKKQRATLGSYSH
jgi:hypothetical protein